MEIIIAILIFCVIIVVHELGHFSAAKLFRMRVYEFALGMGPRLLKFTRGGTVYCLKAIPFGGSVQLGEDSPEQSDDPADFRNKPAWQRVIVMLAGVIMNLLLGALICIVAAAAAKTIIVPIVGGFKEDAVSSQFLQKGDVITKVNGMRIFTTSDISYQLYNTESKFTLGDTAFFDFTVKRGDEILNFPAVPFMAENKPSGGRSIYFDLYVTALPKTAGNVISSGINNALTLSRLIVISFADMLKGTYGLNDFAGPVGVVNEIGNAAAMGAGELMTLSALITLNVAIFNLVPFPALDGARTLFLLVEIIRRKPVKPGVENIIHFAGFAVLMIFMLVVTFNDVRKLLGLG